jgi:hypothetical protein
MHATTPARWQRLGCGEFTEVNATAVWSARQPGFEFVSDPAPTSVPVFAIVGREENGSYFG